MIGSDVNDTNVYDILEKTCPSFSNNTLSTMPADDIAPVVMAHWGPNDILK